MVAELLEPRLWAALVVVILAGVLRGFTGFGAAMMIMPVLSTLYLPSDAVAMMMCLSLVATIQLLPRALKTTDWQQVTPITISALLAVPLGALVLVSVEPEIMRRAIGGGVLFFGLLLASGWRLHGRAGLAGALTAGSMSGAINGASGAGGGPVVLYMLAGPNSAETNRSSIITYYAILNAVTALTLGWHGVFSWPLVQRAALLMLPFLAATWLGTHLFLRSSDAAYRKLALVALVGVGLYGLLSP